MVSKYLNPGQLVSLSDDLFATHAAYYHKRYRSHTRKYSSGLIEATTQLKFLLDLDVMRVVIKPIQPRHRLGLFIPSNQVIFLDPRRACISDLIFSLCHEGLHLKQMLEGQLQWKEYAFWWHDTKITPSDMRADNDGLDRYNDLPWEQDVQTRLADLYERLRSRLSFETLKAPFNHRGKLRKNGSYVKHVNL